MKKIRILVNYQQNEAVLNAEYSCILHKGTLSSPMITNGGAYAQYIWDLFESFFATLISAQYPDSVQDDVQVFKFDMGFRGHKEEIEF